jgi:lactoylglutathione lyase
MIRSCLFFSGNVDPGQPDLHPHHVKEREMTAWLRQYCFHVTDIERSIKFYEAIGLTCTSRTQITDEIKEAVVENPGRGAWLQLAENSTIKGPIDMGTAFWKLYIYTDDCEGIYQKALAAGATSHTAPVRLERWPTLVAFVTCPDGYLIEFLQRDESPTENNAGGSPRDQSVN